MNDAPLGLTEFGFWLAVGFVIVALIWANIKKQQMKHELTLKLLEKGQDLDQELLSKLLTTDKAAAANQPKSAAEKRRQDRSGFVAVFLIGGVSLAFLGMLMRGHTLQPVGEPAAPGLQPMMMFVDTGPSWPVVALGAFCFVLGFLFWLYSNREYKREKAAEDQSQD